MATINPAVNESVPYASLQESSSKLQDVSIPQSFENDDNKEDTTALTAIAEHLMAELKAWRIIVQVALLVVAVFCAFACFSLPTAFFPQKAKDKGLTEVEIGTIFSVYPAAAFIMAPVYGTLVSPLCYITCTNY